MALNMECVLYHSRMACDADLSCVAEIVKTARSFNKEAGITGMLVFDGQRFCQYIEGPAPVLRGLVDSIAQDARHTHFTIKHQGEVSGERLFAHWSMAYVLVDDSEPLDELNQLEGLQALSKLQALIPMLDIA